MRKGEGEGEGEDGDGGEGKGKGKGKGQVGLESSDLLGLFEAAVGVHPLVSSVSQCVLLLVVVVLETFQPSL